MKSEIFSNYLIIWEAEQSDEHALVYLFESLIDLKDPKMCELFLDTVQEDFLSSDAIVHILNALSPKKEKIKNWDSFVSMCEKKLIELEGKELAMTLLNILYDNP